MHKWRMQETTRAEGCRYIPGRVPVEYDRPGMVAITDRTGVRERGSAGVEMGRCRYEIPECFKYVTCKSLRNIIYIYLYYINIIYRI
jgi:hypothetical protein